MKIVLAFIVFVFFAVVTIMYMSDWIDDAESGWCE